MLVLMIFIFIKISSCCVPVIPNFVPLCCPVQSDINNCIKIEVQKEDLHGYLSGYFTNYPCFLPQESKILDCNCNNREMNIHASLDPSHVIRTSYLIKDIQHALVNKISVSQNTCDEKSTFIILVIVGAVICILIFSAAITISCWGLTGTKKKKIPNSINTSSWK
jgi:hypothetical protein